MAWLIVLMWVETFDYDAPRIANNVEWFTSEADCQQALMDKVNQYDDLIITKDPDGIVVEFPNVSGKGYMRCMHTPIPDWMK